MLRKMFFVLLLVVLLTGCAGTGASQAATTEITVAASDFAFTPAIITVSSGQPVTLTLNNTGVVEHDFVVNKINVTDVEASNTVPAAHHQMGDNTEYDLHFLPGQETQPS